MGGGTSKYFRLKNEKKTPKTTKTRSFNAKTKDFICRGSTEVKNDVLRQLHSECAVRSTHFGKGGVAFYTPLKEDLDPCCSPTNLEAVQTPQRPGIAPHKSDRATHMSRPNVLAESFTPEERELMADVLKADHLRQKCRRAMISEEQRHLAARRRDQQEAEVRQRHLVKMRAAEQRRLAVQERLRPSHVKVDHLYDSG